jgi:hypothetical protein
MISSYEITQQQHQRAVEFEIRHRHIVKPGQGSCGGEGWASSRSHREHIFTVNCQILMFYHKEYRILM